MLVEFRSASLILANDDSKPAPGVVEAITDTDLVILPPSNPVVSVGTILGVPRVREAITSTRAPVVGLSPIVGGTHVRGMAEQMLTSIGVEVSAAGVGLHYGARTAGGAWQSASGATRTCAVSIGTPGANSHRCRSCTSLTDIISVIAHPTSSGVMVDGAPSSNTSMCARSVRQK